MAEETTSATSDQQLSQIINQLLSGKTAQPAVDPNTGPSSRDGRTFLSLLGEGLGGGAQYGSTQEREQGGLSALGAAGSRLLQASDWSVMPHTFGSILGQGLDAARGNLGQTQAVSAARQYAAQQLAHQQQEDQINRLKEALPYLQLMQNREAIKGMPGSLLGGGGSNTSIGAAGTTSGTFFDALAKIESDDQNIVSRVDKDSKGRTLAQGGNPDEISQGHYQINPDTWRRYAKQAGVDPSQFPNPMKAPKEVQAQVASVIPLSAFGPRTQKLLRDQFGDLDTSKTIGALAGARAAPSAPGTATAPPKAAPGQASSPKAGGLQVAPEPPLATTAPGQTAQGPEEGTVQVAGGGAPTSGVIPTLPPAAAARSAADVADIEAGRAEARATPLVHQPGAVVTAQAGGQPPDPNSFEAYRLAHPIAPPAPEQRMLFDAGLTPEQQKAHDTQLKALEVQYQAARAKGDPTAAAAAQEKLVTLETATSTLRENARKLAVEKQAEYYKDQDKQRFDAWTAQQAQLNKQAEEDRKHANALELARVNADFDKDKEGAKIAMEGDKKRMQDQATSAAAMQPVSEQLRQLPALMSKLPPGGALSSLMGQYPQMIPVLKGAGIIDPETADNVSIFMGLTNHLAGQLRVTGSGSMSDKDLASFKTVMPQLLQSPEGRLKAVAFLQNIADRVVEGQEFTQAHFRRIDPKTGKPAYNLDGLKDAINAPRGQGGLGPVVPAAPKFSQDEKGANDARAWMEGNVRSGRPFTAWLPNKDGVLTQQLLVRE
jgi:hypothetical protein